MNKIAFVGFGELTWDKNFDIFIKLIKENGGGTTWNVLSNLGNMNQKVKSYAIGVCGNDQYGERAKQKLKQSNVNIDNIQTIDKPTNTVHSIIPAEINSDSSIIYSMKSPLTQIETYKLSEELPTNCSINLQGQTVIIILENFRRQNLEFLKNFNDKRVVMDIGRKKVLEDKEKDFLIEYLKKVDLVQISSEILDELYKILETSNLQELFKLISPELLILTNGRKEVNFLFKENGEVKTVKKTPKSATKIVDTTGAGDSFLSVIINGYGRYIQQGKKIDNAFIDKIFPIANKLSIKAIGQLGGRCEKETILSWSKEIKEKTYEENELEI